MLYCQIPFGKFHLHNPDIIRYAKIIGRTPSALAMKLSNIASLDPEIISTGRKGLQGASMADKLMWEEMQSNWDEFIDEFDRAQKTFGQLPELNSEIQESESLDDFKDYSGKDRVGKTKIRIDQKFFRASVLSAYDFKCCISGLSVPQLLIASHIVPWRIDQSNRLNPRNGLCLSVLHDKVFDLGMITIDKNFKVKVSKKIIPKSDTFFNSTILNYEGKKISLPEKFLPNLEFLAFHRENIFEQEKNL